MSKTDSTKSSGLGWKIALAAATLVVAVVAVAAVKVANVDLDLEDAPVH